MKRNTRAGVPSPDIGDARFRSVAETAADAIVSADNSERITYFNPAAERIFGHRAAAAIGQPLTLIMPERYHAAHLRGFARFRATGVPRLLGRTVELAARRRDGSEFPVELSLSTWTVDGIRGFTAIIRDISERKSAEAERTRLAEQTRADRERLRELSVRLLEVQESERRRIARELHDEIGQVLTAVHIDLQSARRLTEPRELAAHLEESAAAVRRALHQVRDLSLDLRPPLLDDFGLVPALQWLLERQAQRVNLITRLDADPLPTRPPPNVETICFRVAQEALTNVARHAHAREVSVELRVDGGMLHLCVHDDGVGFDVAAAQARAARGGSLGLAGLEERVSLGGGHITIESALRRGTTIRIRVPLEADAPSVVPNAPSRPRVPAPKHAASKGRPPKRPRRGAARPKRRKR